MSAPLLSKAESFIHLVIAHIEHGDDEHRKWLQDELLKLLPTLKVLFKEL